MKKIFIILFCLSSLIVFAEDVSVEKMSTLLRNIREDMNCIGYDVFDFNGNSKEKVLINYQDELVIYIDYETNRIQAWVAPSLKTDIVMEEIKDHFICQGLPEDEGIKLYKLGGN